MKNPESTRTSQNQSNSILTVSVKAKTTLQPLYKSYFNMKDALTEDDLAQAQKAAEEMKQALSKVNMSLFTGDAHNAWMKQSSSIQNALQHTAHFKTILEFRNAFNKVSGGMIAITQTFRPYGKILYQLHCSMFDDNKGADWLSLSKDIKNPYYGKSMQNCGVVKTTINWK